MNSNILDHRGNVAQFSTYTPITETLRKDWRGHSKGDLSTDDALPQRDRYQIIAWLRAKYRGNGLFTGIINAYATGIGAPSARVNTGDPIFNDLKERYLEDKFSRITWGSYKDLDHLLFCISVETALAGECYVVKMANAKVRIVPAELLGSPDNAGKNEKDGIIYGLEGQAVKYRVGKRDKKGKVDYENATLIDASNVWHVNPTTTAEERRAFPPLAASIKDIYDLTTIKDAKTESIKLQSAISLFISKHVDPAIYSSTIEQAPEYSEELLRASYSRSQIVNKGSILYGEVGEDIKTIQSNTQSADFDQFYFNLIQAICSPLGMPVEEVLGYHRSNYSSSRAEKIKWKAVISKIRKSHHSWLNDLQAWQVNRGRIDGSFTLSDPQGSRGLIIDWIFPHVPEIDEAKSASANIALYTSGLASRTEAASKRGRYIDEVNNEMVNEAEQLVQMIKDRTGDKSPISKEDLLSVMNKGGDISKALETLNNINDE